MKNSILKTILILTSLFIIPTASFAVGESQLPVSTSYDDVLQSAKMNQNISTSPASGDIEVQATTASTTGNETQVQSTNSADVDANSESQIQQAIDKKVKSEKPKSHIVNTVFKFLLAMLWVCISSVVIFMILLSYKKLILKGKPVVPTYESTEETLDTPKNFKEAIKLFLDKTKWN